MRNTMNRRIRELARTYVRMKQAALSKVAENDLSLDPRPALPPPEPKERTKRKPVRRVFPFKRYKNSGADHAETE